MSELEGPPGNHLSRSRGGHPERGRVGPRSVGKLSYGHGQFLHCIVGFNPGSQPLHQLLPQGSVFILPFGLAVVMLPRPQPALSPEGRSTFFISCLLKHMVHSQQPKGGNDPNVHAQTNKSKWCISVTEYYLPWKAVKFSHRLQHGRTLKTC